MRVWRPCGWHMRNAPPYKVRVVTSFSKGKLIGIADSCIVKLLPAFCLHVNCFFRQAILPHSAKHFVCKMRANGCKVIYLFHFLAYVPLTNGEYFSLYLGI